MWATYRVVEMAASVTNAFPFQDYFRITIHYAYNKLFLKVQTMECIDQLKAALLKYIHIP